MITISETITENIFRDFYNNDKFIEKSAIPKSYGFISKNKTENPGYPDFFLDDTKRDFVVIVEAKALKHSDAEEDVKWYMEHNAIKKTVIGIAVSGQEFSQIKYHIITKLRDNKKLLSFK